MKQTITGPSMPTAAICINKSRLKVYTKDSTNTYYLENGTAFQIELFNPKSETVLAKIELNGKPISQGGLVLRPGERVFLERYIDVAKKFLFDTYEVSNTSEVKEAIKNNGDFKVEFYLEQQPLYNIPVYNPINIQTYIQPYFPNSFYYGNTNLGTSTLTGGYPSSSTLTSTNSNNGIGLCTLDSATYSNNTTSARYYSPMDKIKSLRSASKTIETGRVELGDTSNQKLTTVSKSFNHYPFHSIEYNLLPISQKINSTDDIKVKKYCHSCGAVVKYNHKYCSSCGAKQ